MTQLEELRSKLISKETELSLLQADISMLAVDRDNKIMEIEGNSSKEQVLMVLAKIIKLWAHNNMHEENPIILFNRA